MEADWRSKCFWGLIALALVIPVFFQLQGSIYLDRTNLGMVDSGGKMALVPLPVSLFACIVGLIAFWRATPKSKLVLIVTFSMLALLAISCVIAGASPSKITLALQFMLPFSALVLGRLMPLENRARMARIFLYFLLVFVPFQLMATWAQGNLALTHNLYIFSVYQHYQYVPLIMVSLYAWAWVELHDSHLSWILALSPWIGIYVAAGNSVLALFGIVAFSCLFAFARRASRRSYLAPLLIIVSIVSYFYLNSQVATQLPKYKLYHGVFVGKFFTAQGQPLHFFTQRPFGFNAPYGAVENSRQDGKVGESNAPLADSRVPVNVAERIPMAGRYWQGITESMRTMLFGHNSPPPRNEITSAHNYYLDIAYNFGALSLFPVLGLILYTAFLSWKNRDNDPCVIWMVGIVLFIAVVDSNLKVTLRQPYPGLATFFLWGILLSILSSNPAIGRNEKT